MTAISYAPATSASRRGRMNRVLAVTRLHFVDIWSIFAVPFMIMIFILLVNMAIWWLILTSISDPESRANAQEGFSYSGASFYIYVYMMVVAIMTINLTFSFATGYGVTRRNFYLGTCIAFVTLSLLWAVVLTALSYIEQATNGWALGGHMFSAIYFGDGAWYQRVFLHFVGMAFFFFVGAAVATVYVRWKASGMLTFFASLVVLLVGGAALVTLTESWPRVGEWFVDAGSYGVAAWLLVPTALAAAAGWLVLRKATPRT
ncbi:hypothetical protein [Glaciihabitans sp. dw_435]|uniref:hypothetical protein n=1 Tax=Glaciihabitans sp. dw_435 TaxID=2720081 RepID=UPI001BD1CA56|nr:hypothetical protein [Glaciihabitans sp. dw_435]